MVAEIGNKDVYSEINPAILRLIEILDTVTGNAYFYRITGPVEKIVIERRAKSIDYTQL